MTGPGRRTQVLPVSGSQPCGRDGQAHGVRAVPRWLKGGMPDPTGGPGRCPEGDELCCNVVQ